MRIERLTVSSFRNLADFDVPLQPGTVIVGENRISRRGCAST
jgi:recombinational DNA repair ATPase RecF